ncbi:PREDICTED: general transcription factor IIF subunit 2 [Charadrius vociferus]|uniref:general transcription factor IIF subunit 2 n=1 Tax=Charadrius vociferus TaxID=50402 RepID=UPI000521BF29|nr:PREDICTED: general transcription factor IIF subunit 2 [Charadrius vociferus]
MGDFNHPDIRWRDKTAGHKQSRTFLECVDDKFLLQVTEKPTRRGVMLELVPTKKKEELVGNVKLKGSLGCSYHEIVEFKVPKYLSQQWNKASGRGEVGKLRIAKNQGRTEVSFTLNEELASINDIGGKPASVSAPREHPFLLQSVGGQTLTVFTESSVGQPEDKSESGSTDKLSLEGIVVQRAECRPAASENYMKLKRLQIEESSKPVRLSQQLDKAVTTNYKPVANHQYNIEYEKKKKEDGKRARADKQQVLDMLFSAFEKHQYYNIKDLVDITKQPVIYLKEILREIGIYNVKGTHKNTWELKPEYRHYQGEDKSD